MVRKDGTLKKTARGFLIALVWIGVWQFAALAVGTEFFLPAPWAVLKALFVQAQTSGFWNIVGFSLLRVLSGYVAGVAIGTGLGIVTAKVRCLDALFSPVLTVIRATPVASFILLALVFLNRNLVPTFIVILMVLPIVWANVAEGVRSVDRSLSEVCRVYGMSVWRRLRILDIPHCLPYFSAGAVTALGLAWKAGISAEVLCTPKFSIGKKVYDAKVYLETADLFAWTLVVVALSLGLELLLKWALNRRAKQ